MGFVQWLIIADIIWVSIVVLLFLFSIVLEVIGLIKYDAFFAMGRTAGNMLMAQNVFLIAVIVIYAATGGE